MQDVVEDDKFMNFYQNSPNMLAETFPAPEANSHLNQSSG